MRSEVKLVIGDLGLALQTGRGKMAFSVCGTPINMAPEILTNQNKGYDSKVDVWSLGTIFYHMLTGFEPFTGTDQESVQSCIAKGNYWLPKDVNLSIEGLTFLN